jgi:hypothetical protein
MPTGQARFTKRYTTEQKHALMHAVLVDKITTAEACRRAPHGRLGVEAFTIDPGYADSLISKGRVAFEAATPEALRTAIDGQLIKLAAKALKQARALEAQDVADPDQIRTAIKALKEAKTGLAAPVAKPKVPQAPGSEEPAKPGADVLSGLLAGANGKG